MTNETIHSSGKILEPELSYDIQGSFFAVANSYGSGLKEYIYQQALAEEFAKRNILFEQQKRISIHSLETGKVLGAYIPDFVAKDKIIIEIKSTPTTLRQHIEQHRAYLRVSMYEIGYLVNFGTPEVDVQRSIYTNDRKPFLVKRGNS